MSNETLTEWNVLRTRSRQEKSVERILIQKEIHVYLPKLPCPERNRNIELPLFPGYVFVKPNRDQFYSMNFIPGTCGIIFHRGVPGVVREKELSAIRKIVTARIPFDLHIGLLPGTLVKVIKGPLAGIDGELVRFKKSQRLVINASILGQSVSVEINSYEVIAV